MKTSESLIREAEIQRQALRAELDALRQRPTTLVRDLAGSGLGAIAMARLLPRVFGPRAPWLVYGWLAFRAWRRLFPADSPEPRRSGQRPGHRERS